MSIRFITPSLLGFTGNDALYHRVNAAGVLAVVSLGLTDEPAPRGSTIAAA